MNRKIIDVKVGDTVVFSGYKTESNIPRLLREGAVLIVEEVSCGSVPHIVVRVPQSSMKEVVFMNEIVYETPKLVEGKKGIDVLSLEVGNRYKFTSKDKSVSGKVLRVDDMTTVFLLTDDDKKVKINDVALFKVEHAQEKETCQKQMEQQKKQDEEDQQDPNQSQPQEQPQQMPVKRGRKKKEI